MSLLVAVLAIAAAIVSYISSVSAFFFSGRFMRMVRMGPSSVTRISGMEFLSGCRVSLHRPTRRPQRNLPTLLFDRCERTPRFHGVRYSRAAGSAAGVPRNPLQPHHALVHDNLAIFLHVLEHAPASVAKARALAGVQRSIARVEAADRDAAATAAVRIAASRRAAAAGPAAIAAAGIAAAAGRVLTEHRDVAGGAATVTGIASIGILAQHRSIGCAAIAAAAVAGGAALVEQGRVGRRTGAIAAVAGWAGAVEHAGIRGGRCVAAAVAGATAVIQHAGIG